MKLKVFTSHFGNFSVTYGTISLHQFVTEKLFTFFENQININISEPSCVSCKVVILPEDNTKDSKEN